MKIEFKEKTYEMQPVTAGRKIDVSSTILSLTKGTFNDMVISDPSTALLVEAQVYIMYYIPDLSEDMRVSIWEMSLKDAYSYVELCKDIIKPKIEEEERIYRELFSKK